MKSVNSYVWAVCERPIQLAFTCSDSDHICHYIADVDLSAWHVSLIKDKGDYNSASVHSVCPVQLQSAWNSLRLYIRTASTPVTFGNRLKTYVFIFVQKTMTVKQNMKLMMYGALCSKARFPLPELTARVDGCQKCSRVDGRQLGPFTRAVNSGNGNRA